MNELVRDMILRNDYSDSPRDCEHLDNLQASDGGNSSDHPGRWWQSFCRFYHIDISVSIKRVLSMDDYEEDGK